MPSAKSIADFWRAAERVYLSALEAEGWSIRRIPQGYEAVRGRYGLSAPDVPALVTACRRADEDWRGVRRRLAAGRKGQGCSVGAVDGAELALFPSSLPGRTADR